MVKRIQEKIKAFLREDEGATAIEYALIGALISTAIIGGVTALGTSNLNMYNNISTAIVGAG